MTSLRNAVRALLAATFLPLALNGQVIDLTVANNGIAIGDKPRVNGLRLNFRDRNLEEVNGVNVTIWSPYSRATGRVNGLALGIPATGARSVHGAMVGVIGGGVEDSFEGLALGGIGIGSGGSMRGIVIGGIGAGSGGGMTGLTIGGIGVGSGGSMRGIQVGGIGVGSAGDVTGISVGGIGIGSGANVTGLSVGGIGVGAGGRLEGLSVGGIGVGAPTVRGVAVAGLGVGGVNVHAIVLTPGYFKVEKEGRFDGGAVASFNNVRGRQHGLTLGLVNYARELHGVQIGLINVSDNDGKRRVLPLLSLR